MNSRYLTPVLDHLRQLAGARQADQLSDSQLLERFIREREEGAFATLIQRHGPMVLGVCQRTVQHAHDAEDVFQATFLVLARKAASVAKRDSLGSWLHGVARRLGGKFKVREMQRRTREHRIEPPPVAEPIADIAWRELQALLDAEVQRLPARYREPLILCYLEGKTHEEVARQFGCPVGTVHSWLVRGRELLRERLRRKGLTLAATAFAAALTVQTAGAIPPALVERTAHAAACFVVGEAALPAISETAVLLARAGVRNLLPLRLSVALAGSLVFGLAALGTALWGEPFRATPPAAAVGAAPQPSASAPPQKEPPVPTDRYGDPLPDGAIARLGPARFRLTSRDGTVAATQDGKGILTGSQSGDALVWSSETGKVVRRMAGHRGTVATVISSPDGRMLASAGQDKIIRLWDWPAGKEQGTLVGHEHWVDGLAFSPDGRLLASHSWDGTVRLWDLATRKELRRMESSAAVPAGGQMTQPLAFTPDGKQLASAHGRYGVLVWEVTTGKQLREIKPPGEFALGVTCSPDGKTLATAFLGEAGPRIDLWNADDGKKLRSLSCLGSKQDSVSGYGLLFTPDSRTLIAGGHGVFAWDVATGKEQAPLTPRGHLWVSGLAWAADGKNLITRGAALAVFDFTKRKKLTAWDGHEGEVRSLALSPDGKVLASGAGDPAVRLWDIAAGREIGQLADGLGGTRHLAWSADGQRLIAAGSDGVLRTWDVARQKLERQFSVELELLDEMAVAPRGDTAAVIAWDFLNRRARITLWDVAAGKKLRQMEMVTRDMGPGGAVFSPDGRILASYLADGALHLWDVGTGKKLGECNGGGKDILATVIFSPDGRSLVSVPIETIGQEERVIRLWDVATGKEVRQFRGSARWVPGAAFSPDGRTLFTGGVDGTLRLWEVATGMQRAILKGDQPMISCVAFAPSGALLISGSHDSTILVWDARHVFQSSAATDATMAADTWKALWQELASDDAAAAYQAVGRLGRASQTVAQARLLLQPVKSADAERVQTLVEQLESEDFLVRQRASQELETLGDLAEPALRRRLAAGPPLEARQRIDGLLGKLPARSLSSEELRTWRAMEVLERMATPAACRVLERLAAGAPESRLTRAAKSSMDRIPKE